MKGKKSLARFLNEKADEYNNPGFIAADPISIPHSFTRKQDIEIAGFFAAIFSWGNRTTIINKSKELMGHMDNAPHDFILNHRDQDLKRLLDFKHRTFNATDLLYFVDFFKHHYSRHDSLEDAFLNIPGTPNSTKGKHTITPISGGPDMTTALTGFYNYFFSLEDAPTRTFKHIASPEKNSSCKRLNMYLRWMVRSDDKGVDFGLWTRISPANLICPLDVHVARVARRLGLLNRTQTDWTAALELSSYLSELDPSDPAKYDFALFGLGVMEKF